MRFGSRAILGALLLWATAHAADQAHRGDIVEILDLLRSPYRVERIEGVQKAAGLTNKALVDEFRLDDRIVSIARSRQAQWDERCAALQALVDLAEKRIVEPVRIVRDLEDVLENENEDLDVRVEALDLLARLGRVDAVSVADQRMVQRVEGLIMQIARNEGNPALRAKACTVLGRLAPDGASEVLFEAAAVAPQLAVRRSAMEGLSNYIRARNSRDDRLVYRLRTMAQEMTGAAQTGLRLASIQAIEQLLANGSQPDRGSGGGTVGFLIDRLQNGADDEIIAASRALLRTQDTRVADAIMSKLAQAPENPAVREALLKGVIELFGRLRVQAARGNGSQRQQAHQNAQRIVNNFLAPVATMAEAPEDVRRIAIMGLGGVPYVFDRQAAVNALISTMAQAREGAPELAEFAEKQLMRIARISRPYRTLEGEIDVAAWQRWFAAHRDPGLTAGRRPWEAGL